MNSVVDHENNLMHEMQLSYPDQDVKNGLGLLPIVIDEDYMSNCARSSSGQSDLSLINHNRDGSHGTARCVDVLAMGPNGKD